MNGYILLKTFDCRVPTHLNAQLFQAVHAVVAIMGKSVAVFLLPTNCMYPVAGRVEMSTMPNTHWFVWGNLPL